ncbi:MAG TPA: hypothetical protein VEK33_14250 [Terriglobales bacterium]|nr:hypothetical protein [Terriglobales bacterium]
MNSRLAISALFILIAVLVIASQGTGLLEKLKVLQATCANKVSEVRALPVLDHSGAAGNPARAAGTMLPDAQTITFNFPNATHVLGAHARHLQRFVLNLIHSDHQGE